MELAGVQEAARSFYRSNLRSVVGVRCGLRNTRCGSCAGHISAGVEVSSDAVSSARAAVRVMSFKMP